MSVQEQPAVAERVEGQVFGDIVRGENPYFPTAAVEETTANAEDIPQDGATGEQSGDAVQAESGEESFVPEGVEVDFDSPEYKHLMQHFTRANQKKSEELRQQLELLEAKVQQGAPATEPETQVAASQTAIDYSQLGTPDYGLSEGSYFEDTAMQSDNQKMIRAEIDLAVRHLQGQAQQEQAQVARQAAGTVLEKWEAGVKSDPNYEAVKDKLYGLVNQFGDAALKDPATFTKFLESQTGLSASAPAPATTPPPAPNGVPAQRLATKARSQVPRSTGNGRSAVPAGAPATLSAGISAALAEHGIN